MQQLHALGPSGAPVLLVDGGIDVAVHDEQVEPAIVVVVEEGGAPAEEGHGGFSDAGLVADVSEVGVAVVAVERLVVVGEGGVEEVDEAVVGEVPFGDAHAGGLAAAFVEGVAGGKGDVFEGAIALVEIEVVRRGVVGDEQVGFAIAVDVDEERGEAIVGVLIGDAGVLADISEGAVAVVVEEVVRLALEPVRPTQHVDAEEGAERERDAAIALQRLAGEVPMHVAGDEEIEATVAVEIAPGGAGGPIAERHASLRGDIGEGAVVIVAIEAILSEVGDVDVGPAIVIEVADDGAEAPAIVGDAGLRGDVGEGAVVVVVEEGGVRRGCLAGLSRDV